MSIINKIFLVDDDNTFVFITKKIIGQLDLLNKLEIFGNGLEALNYLKENSQNFDALPEIIILDLSMPVMDGWQFLDEFEKIKLQMAKKITIYICTSSITPEDILKSQDFANVKEYIIKPITKDKILSIIKGIDD